MGEHLVSYGLTGENMCIYIYTLPIYLYSLYTNGLDVTGYFEEFSPSQRRVSCSENMGICL